MSLIKNYEQYLEALETSPTEMFWVIPDDVEVCREFGFDIYFPPDDEYNRKMNHVFLNGNTYDGVMLMSKHRKISKKEFENRFPIERKEWDLIASRPKKYEIKVINSYQEYLEASKTSNTDMFWWVPNDVVPADNFTFDYYIPVYDFFHRNITHIFKNGNTYDGIVLFSKNVIVSEEEFNNRSFKEKKEVDIVASQPQPFEKFELESYQNYLDAIENCKTDLFWFIPKDVEINSKFTFDYYIPKYDNFHRNITHVFKNANTYDGIALFPKHNKITQKEFENRFYLEKKEVNVIASTPKPFPSYSILDFDDYEKILKECDNRMFWCIWPEIEITDTSILNYYISYHDTYNSNENHVFKNKMKTEISFYNGLVLFSKNKKISKKEFTRRYLIEKKEHNKVVSKSRYKKYNLTSYEQYLDIVDKEVQDMFWGVWPEIVVTDSNIFDLYFDPRNGIYDYDRKVNHTFINKLDNSFTYYNGLVLFSKHNIISKKEFDRRYIIDKKEHPTCVSKSQYPIHYIKDYDHYLKIFEHEIQPMFWCIWPEVEVINKDVFDLYFDPKDGKYDYDRETNHMFQNNCNGVVEYYNGILLCSKKNKISKKEYESRYLVDKKEHSSVASKSKYPVYKIKSFSEYETIFGNETQPMFWCIWPEVEVINKDVFDLYFDPRDGKYDFDRSENHVFKNNLSGTVSFINGIVLFSKVKKITKKEFDRRYIFEKKDHDKIVSKSRYPQYHIKNYDQYIEIASTTKSAMFWCIWPEIKVFDESVFDLYFDERDGKYDYDRGINHVFLNSCADNNSFFNGLVLCSTKNIFSKKEFDRRYVIDKKEHNVLVSKSVYPSYKISNYETYLEIIQTETQPMFWCIWPEVEILNDKVFDLYFDPKDGKYDFDRQNHHIFKNMCYEDASYHNGIVLVSKNKEISKKEFDRRYVIDKKEHDTVATIFRYSRYVIKDYEQYLEIVKKETQSMFWCIWPEVELIDQSVFDLYFDPRDGKYDFDRQSNHIFKNECAGNSSYFNGILLCSKNNLFSKKEFDRRYVIDKKEHDRTVSKFKYNRYTIDTYEDYLNAINKESQPMFWGIWSELEITNQSVFDLYFDPRDGKYDFDRQTNHVFSNKIGKDIDTDGIVLFNKSNPVSKKEIDFRFIIDKKMYSNIASETKLYDIVFISYKEINADENYARLLDRFPNAKRLHGVHGIHQAHIEAAKMASSHMFWVVDGDAIINNNFNFDYLVNRYERDVVYVWKSINPINDLIYGYGGVKLLPRDLTLKLDINSSDMTTSISKKFKAMPEVSNITSFNTDEFSTWRSAFRECVKLSSKTIDRQQVKETEERLNIWCSVGADRLYGDQAILGAKMGKKYGEENKNSPEALKKINDFTWLKELWEKNK